MELLTSLELFLCSAVKPEHAVKVHSVLISVVLLCSNRFVFFFNYFVSDEILVLSLSI